MSPESRRHLVEIVVRQNDEKAFEFGGWDDCSPGVGLANSYPGSGLYRNQGLGFRVEGLRFGD